MKSNLKKLAANVLVLSLVMIPTAFAQGVSNASSTPVTVPSAKAAPALNLTSPSTDTPAPVSVASTSTDVARPEIAASSTPALPLILQGSVTTMQDATTTQPAVTSQVLENTANPELATSSGITSTPLKDSSTSTPATQPMPLLTAASSVIPFPVDESTSSVDVVAQNIDTTPPPPQPIVPEPQLEVQKLAAVIVIDAAPQPEFTFALTGKQIPTIRKVESKDGSTVTVEAIAAPITSRVDNVKGEVAVSGQCTDAYFVVLLFKNANDYADDPRSYIVNRAYPCVGGAFSYSIADLPSTLPNGNYYLLVGEEGSKGSWKPITSQTEITINKK